MRLRILPFLALLIVPLPIAPAQPGQDPTPVVEDSLTEVGPDALRHPPPSEEPLPDLMVDNFMFPSPAGSGRSSAAPEGGWNPLDPLVELDVNGQRWPWVPLAPFPADLNDDLVPDGLLTVTFDGQEVCLEMVYLVALNRPSYRLGVRYDDQAVVLNGTSLPGDFRLCGRTAPDRPAVRFESNSPRGDLWARVEVPGTVFELGLDRMPGEASFAYTSLGGDVFRAKYEADRVLDVYFRFRRGGTDIAGAIENLPTSFEGSFHRTVTRQASTITEVHARYTASSGIDQVIVQYGRTSLASWAAVKLVDLPRSFSGTASWRHDGSMVYYGDYRQSASSGLSNLIVSARTSGTPFWMQVSDLPATIDEAYLHIEEVGATSTTKVHWSADAPASKLYVRFGTEGEINSVLGWVPTVPAFLHARLDLRRASGTLQELAYSHEASDAVPLVFAEGNLADQVVFWVPVFDIPAKVDIRFAMRPVPGAALAPLLTYQGSAPGLSFKAWAEGLLFGPGGYVWANVSKLPRTLVTTAAKESNGFVLDLDTRQTGVAEYVFLAAKLPLLLPTDFFIRLRDLAHFAVRATSVLLLDDCGYPVCQYFEHRGVARAEIWHGGVAFSIASATVGIHLQYTVQQFTDRWRSVYTASPPGMSLYTATPSCCTIDPRLPTRAVGIPT